MMRAYGILCVQPKPGNFRIDRIVTFGMSGAEEKNKKFSSWNAD